MTSTKALTESAEFLSARALGVRSQSRSTPIEAFAWFGAALLALQIYVWAKWVTGPNFVAVPTGVSDPPGWMKIPLAAQCIFTCFWLPVSSYLLIVRPWLRERRITTDGMLLASFGLMCFQDPLLNYTNVWCTYNSWLLNRGTWALDIPGWHAWGAPGRVVVEPLLIILPGYSGVLLCTMAVCWFMRRIKARWPDIGGPAMLAATYAFSVVLDVVMEGCILVPMGTYVYPGAIRSVSAFPGTYFQFPAYQALLWGLAQTGFAVLRYYTDDKGRTFAERGLERVKGGFAKQQLTRFLAVFAVVSLIFFFGYNLPTQWFGTHADAWPEDVQKRSYFTSGICGEGTDRLCPNPLLPIESRDSAHIDPSGKLVMPEGTELPKVVSFERAQ